MSMPNPDPMIGRKFHRLTVLEFAGFQISSSGKRIIHRRRLYKCLCECGKTIDVIGTSLRINNTTSCGCYKLDFAQKVGKANATHCHSLVGKITRTYRSWEAMRRRCLDPKSMNYKYYGGRGITVCERWLSFENFLADMGERPVGKTLDRINSNGNYGPSNYRWATPKEQSSNRRPKCS